MTHALALSTGVTLRALAAAALLLLLAACSGGGSTAKFADVNDSPRGKTVPPVALVTLVGLPANQRQLLVDALAEEAGKRDIGLVEGKFENGSFGLKGKMKANSSGGQTTVTYSWVLEDTPGSQLLSVSGSDSDANTPLLMQRIAAATAESLSKRLAELGYATVAMQAAPRQQRPAITAPKPRDAGSDLVAGLPEPESTASVEPLRRAELEAPPPLLPPPDFRPGGKTPVDEIDQETLNGPGSVPSADATAAIEPPAEQPALEPPPAKKQAKQAFAQDIKAVAVVPVQGAGGAGNDELTQAMRRTLKKAGWPVISAPRDDALVVTGKVDLGPASGDRQSVKLAWTVRTPDGRSLGTITQRNDVSTGSLDGGWGDNARFAAEGAAEGIYKLIDKLR